MHSARPISMPVPVRHLLFLAMTAMTLFPAALAQTNASLNLTSTYDDNSFSFYDRRADVYHQAFLGLSHDFSSDYTFAQPFYYGSLVLFRTYDQRSYHQHLLGTIVSIQLDHRDDDDDDVPELPDVAPADTGGDDDSTGVDEPGNEHADSTETSSLHASSPHPHGRASLRSPARPPVVRGPALRLEDKTPPSDSVVTYLQLKPGIGGRFDRKGYKFYDYQAGTALASLRMRLGGPLLARLQYEGEYKRYPSFKQFTHAEHNATLTASARPVMGPEWFASANYGLKLYTETVNFTDSLTTGVTGKGKGGVKSVRKKVSQYSTPSSGQIVLGGGVVQPVGTSTVSLSVLRRLNTSNGARYVDPRAIAGGSEDSFFDDRYGYQGVEMLLEATVTMFRIVETTVAVGALRKVYPTSASDLSGADLPGAPQRIDGRYTFEVHVGIPLARQADGSAAVTLGAGYQFLRNHSNDAYHVYDINQGSVTLEAGL